MLFTVMPSWRENLKKAKLDDFDALWQLEKAFLEEPNRGRGRNGWSAVSLIQIGATEGLGKRVIVKRQQNHFSRSWLHPVRGIPTFEKEFRSILRFRQLGIPTLKPVLFARRRCAADVQAILVTEFLEGYSALDQLAEQWQRQGWPSHALRKKLFAALAAPVRALHRHGFQYNCLYPKHFFVKIANDEIKVRLIDLEKNRWRPWSPQRRLRDLEILHRRTDFWNAADRLRFFKAYCQTDVLDGPSRKLLAQILARYQRKRAT